MLIDIILGVTAIVIGIGAIVVDKYLSNPIVKWGRDQHKAGIMNRYQISVRQLIFWEYAKRSSWGTTNPAMIRQMMCHCLRKLCTTHYERINDDYAITDVIGDFRKRGFNIPTQLSNVGAICTRGTAARIAVEGSVDMDPVLRQEYLSDLGHIDYNVDVLTETILLLDIPVSYDMVMLFCIYVRAHEHRHIVQPYVLYNTCSNISQVLTGSNIEAIAAYAHLPQEIDADRYGLKQVRKYLRSKRRCK